MIKKEKSIQKSKEKITNKKMVNCKSKIQFVKLTSIVRLISKNRRFFNANILKNMINWCKIKIDFKKNLHNK